MSDAETRMVETVAPLWSTERTRAALGLSEAQLAERRAGGELLGVTTDDGAWFYPLSQFETVGGTVRVRPGLAQFFSVLRDADPWTVAMVAATPAADALDGLSPTDWAREDRDVDTLLDFANTLHSEWR